MEELVTGKKGLNVMEMRCLRSMCNVEYEGELGLHELAG